MGAPRQPDDAWSYLRAGNDDETTLPVAAEEDAVHVVEDATPVQDPWRSDLGVWVERDGSPEPGQPGPPRGGWFGDEEPDPSFHVSDSGEVDADADHEPDLEEILESQHYAFDQDGGGEDGGGAGPR